MMSDYLPAYLGLSEDTNWTRSGGIDVRQAYSNFFLLVTLIFSPAIAIEEASR